MDWAQIHKATCFFKAENTADAKQKVGGAPVTQCKLHGLWAGNQFLLSNILWCLASFCVYRLYGIDPVLLTEFN